MTTTQKNPPHARLDLRFRPREVPTFDPKLEVFARPKIPVADAREELARLEPSTPKGRPLPKTLLRAASSGPARFAVSTVDLPGQPRGVFFQVATAPIPDLEAVRAAVKAEQFAVSDTRTGFMAIVPTADIGKRIGQIGVVAVVLSLPGLGMPAEALAAGVGGNSDPSALLDMRGAQPAEDPAAATTAAPAAEPAPAPAAAAPAPAATVPEQVWNAMVNREAELAFVNGATQRVTIISHDAATVTVSPSDGGAITVYAKTDITEVRTPGAAPAATTPGATTTPAGAAPQSAVPYDATPPKRGTGHIITGAIFVGVGAPLFITGLVFLGLSLGYYYIYAPTLAVGAAFMFPGIALMASGSGREKKYKEWQARQGQQARLTLLPSVGRTRDGAWTGNLRFNF